MATKNNVNKLPSFFKPLLWSYDFSLVDPQADKERLIVNTINYGDWPHWQWIIKYYRKEKLKKIIEDIPQSEFRKGAFRLIALLLNIKKMKYASRGLKIKAESNL